jgi:hypothetical protein
MPKPPGIVTLIPSEREKKLHDPLEQGALDSLARIMSRQQSDLWWIKQGEAGTSAARL